LNLTTESTKCTKNSFVTIRVIRGFFHLTLLDNLFLRVFPCEKFDLRLKINPAHMIPRTCFKVKCFLIISTFKIYSKQFGFRLQMQVNPHTPILCELIQIAFSGNIKMTQKIKVYCRFRLDTKYDFFTVDIVL